MDDTQFQLTLTGKSGNTFSFFPRYDLNNEASAKGQGIYVFTDEKMKLADIQFLSGEKEITDTLSRIKEEGAAYFYFKDSTDELQSDADIDDIKEGDDFRKLSD